MSSEERKPRRVLVASNTEDVEARKLFANELGVGRGCQVVDTTADEMFDDRSILQGVEAVLFDNVNPAICAEAKNLVAEIVNVGPSVKAIVVLVGEQDYDRVDEIVGRMRIARGRVCVHRHGEPMERCFDFLAGRLNADQLTGEAKVVMPVC